MITLHNEIADILKAAGRSMSTREIAAQVNRRGNYKKRDGTLVTDFQIHGRTKNYSHLFYRNGTEVSLRLEVKENNADSQQIKSDSDEKAGSTTNKDDVTRIAYLVKSGFKNTGTIGELLVNGLPNNPALHQSGCYAITKPSDYKPEFYRTEEATFNGNVILPWDLERLKNKWVKDVDIVYFGIAGIRSNRTLGKRLTDLIKHGNGRTTDRGPHKGGEIFWQLKGYEDFVLWILPVSKPRAEEFNYLKHFFDQRGKLPFANRQF